MGFSLTGKYEKISLNLSWSYPKFSYSTFCKKKKKKKNKKMKKRRDKSSGLSPSLLHAQALTESMQVVGSIA
jgi:hypothetical protein